MTDKNVTESGIVLQYKVDNIDRETIDELVGSNDLILKENDGVYTATRRCKEDFVVFKWFAEEKEYYSNYSISTLKNSVMKESKIITGFTGDSVNSLEQGLLEAIQKIITESRNV